METSPRPLSPHLQIYRPQLTSILSITHRPAGFAGLRGFIGSWLGYLILFGWSVALFYHLCNGIRHLFWDAGYGFELKTAYASGYAVLVGTVVLTLLAWILGLGRL